jgi:hypothetical protein
MKHTEEQMQATVTAWQSSGLSKKAFCREGNIAYQTFQYWCRRLSQKESPGFAEIKLENQQPGVIELSFPSGARMRLQGQPSAAWLRELVG